jgi:hypothetical protein
MKKNSAKGLIVKKKCSRKRNEAGKEVEKRRLRKLKKLRRLKQEG